MNTRFLLAGRLEGIGRFTHEILRRMAAAHPEHEFIFFFDRPFDPQFVYGPNVKPVVLPPPARHPFLFVIWFECSIRWALRRYKPDIFLSTDGFLCLGTSVPSIPVIHDLAFIHYPQGIGKLMNWYYRWFFPRFARKATHIVAVSEFTRQDIALQYGIRPEKISVVYNAPGEGFKPMPEEEKVKLREQISSGHNYFLYVGALHPRKNVGTLLRAFDRFKEQTGSDHQLVIVGRKAWKTKELDLTYQAMKHQKDVIFTGRLEESRLNSVTAAADALVYIPLFEGFGLPIVEAMACGVPVITSNTSSMPEVGGDAVYLVDPQDDIAVSEYLVALLNPNIRKLQSERSVIRAATFSWNSSAARMMEVLLTNKL